MNSLIERATHQRDCHQQQVSGVWSINAKDFCEETGIANLYDNAVDYQIMREAEDQEEYEADIINQRQRELGYLTDKQLDKIREDSSDVGINDDGYSAYFWDFVVKELEKQNG